MNIGTAEIIDIYEMYIIIIWNNSEILLKGIKLISL